ncbi:hypothetical protein C8R44DRAFT_724636 [Mycena epipterygia]|nr:hypothetical protein C8R44DRAFT_724636 [Mycena epipterygia]
MPKAARQTQGQSLAVINADLDNYFPVEMSTSGCDCGQPLRDEYLPGMNIPYNPLCLAGSDMNEGRGPWGVRVSHGMDARDISGVRMRDASCQKSRIDKGSRHRQTPPASMYGGNGDSTAAVATRRIQASVARSDSDGGQDERRKGTRSR